MSSQHDGLKAFEEAKKKLLEKLNGRDFAQYADDLEREQDAKIKEYHSRPENIKFWEDEEK